MENFTVSLFSFFNSIQIGATYSLFSMIVIDLIVGKQGSNCKRLKEEIKNCSKISLVEDYTRVRDHYVEVCGQTHSYAERGCFHILRYLEHHLNKALPQARIAMHQSNPN